MSVLINKHTRVLVQGITGKNGTFHTEQAIAYGTQIVGGVTPGKGGQRHLDRPVFDSMKEAMRQTEADASVIYVPAPFVLDSVVEAIEAGVKLVVVITEGVPTLDMVKVRRLLDCHPDVRLIGPNCPGVITPGSAKSGLCLVKSTAQAYWDCFPLRYINLRSCSANHGAGTWAIHLYWYWRRSGSGD